MRKISLSEVVSFLLENDDYRILTHSYPDGDTLGSAFALCRALRSIGKRANVAVNGKFPSKFEYLKKHYTEQDFGFRTVVSVDVAAMSLLGDDVMQGVEKIDLCIDHHLTNSVEADHVYVDGTAAAAAEIIYEVVQYLGAEFDEDICAGIYTGVSTDTGCFCYTNTTERSHMVAAKVMGNCDWKEINNINFVVKTRAKVKMERMIYDTMEFYAGGACAIVYTTIAMQDALGAGDDEMEGLANIPRQIEGVKMGITMREKQGGVFKISVRTNDHVNASEFCKQFGGGGHPAAAGCSIEGTLGDVKAKLIRAAEEML